MMGYNLGFESLQELFPHIDARILKSVAMEHPLDGDKAASVVVSEGDKISKKPPFCKVEPDDGGLSLTQWLHPSKLPESYLALLDEEPTLDVKPDLGYVVEKIVLPSRVAGTGSEKGGVCSCRGGASAVKPSIHVQSQTNSELSGSSSKGPVGRRPRRKSEQPWSQNYAEKLRSWKKQGNNNNRDLLHLCGKHEDVSPKQSNNNKKKTCADVRRKQRIDDGIKALAELLPQKVENNTPESILNEIVSHVKLLQLQMRELSRSRLAGEPVSHPLTFIEGYGHYIHHEKMMTKPLEEVMEDLFVNDPDGAASLLESKGLHLMPLTIVEGLC